MSSIIQQATDCLWHITKAGIQVCQERKTRETQFLLPWSPRSWVMKVVLNYEFSTIWISWVRLARTICRKGMGTRNTGSKSQQIQTFPAHAVLIASGCILLQHFCCLLHVWGATSTYFDDSLSWFWGEYFNANAFLKPIFSSTFFFLLVHNAAFTFSGTIQQWISLNETEPMLPPFLPHLSFSSNSSIF